MVSQAVRYGPWMPRLARRSCRVAVLVLESKHRDAHASTRSSSRGPLTASGPARAHCRLPSAASRSAVQLRRDPRCRPVGSRGRRCTRGACGSVPVMRSRRWRSASGWAVRYVSETFFSQDLSLFSRDFAYVHWNIPTCSPIRIFIFGRRYVPILKTFPLFFLKIGVSEA